MKRVCSVFLSTSILVITSVYSNAQQTDDMAGLKSTKSEIDKITYNTLGPEENKPGNILYKINVRAVRDFMNWYPKISNEKWEVLKDGYVVKFVSDSTYNRVFYDKSGHYLHSISNYAEEKLPKNIRASVKTIYYDYAIYSVDEVYNKIRNSPPIYLVYIKYNNTYKTIRVCDGDVYEIRL